MKPFTGGQGGSLRGEPQNKDTGDSKVTLKSPEGYTIWDLVNDFPQIQVVCAAERGRDLAKIQIAILTDFIQEA